MERHLDGKGGSDFTEYSHCRDTGRYLLSGSWMGGVLFDMGLDGGCLAFLCWSFSVSDGEEDLGCVSGMLLG